MSFLNKLNFFGLSPQLYIQGQEKYYSKIGFLLSFLLVFFTIISCWVYGKDIYYKEEPKTTYSEQINSNQKRYDLKDNFNYGFSLQNANWEHYIDESIYTVKIFQTSTIKKVDENGNVKYDFKYTDLQPRRCTLEDFPIDTQYFQNLGFIENLYCADKKEAYGSNAFSNVIIEAQPCKQYLDQEEKILNPIQCKSKEIIDQQLAQNNWAIYFTDQILDPNRYEQPFQFTGRDTYGLCSNQMFRQIDLYFRNVYLEDNIGIIFNDIQEKRGLSFEREKEFSQNTPYQSGEFLRLQLRYEKAKETKVYRTYLNLAQVLANVGGILKVFLVVFTVISYIISQRLYYLALTNELFRFENSNGNNQIGNKNNDSNSGFQSKTIKKSYFQENVENSKNFEKSQITQIIKDQDQNIMQEQQQQEKNQIQNQEEQDHVNQLLSYKDIEQNLPHESDRPQFQSKYKQSIGQMNPNCQEQYQQKENQIFSQPNYPTQQLQNSDIEDII